MEKRQVLAIIPAHNEERIVGDAIRSILNQTYRTDVFVISDNSTDNTVSVARSLGIRVAETLGNTHRKSGAMNQALRQVKGYDFVIFVDADTILADDFVENAMNEFRRNPSLGAVCSRAGIIRPEKMTLWQKALWHFQHVEYAEFDTSRIEKIGTIKVVHGMASVYRFSALLKVMKYREERWGIHEHLYDEENITEDYELTVCMKELGYHVSAGMGMLAWTDVPLSLHELWIQRTRWLRGGIDTLLTHGWNSSTRRDIMNAGFFWVMLVFQILLITFIVMDLLLGFPWQLNLWTAFVLVALWLDGVYRLKFVQDIEIGDALVKILFVPMILYTWFNMVVQLYAYYMAFGRTSKVW